MNKSLCEIEELLGLITPIEKKLLGRSFKGRFNDWDSNLETFTILGFQKKKNSRLMLVCLSEKSELALNLGDLMEISSNRGFAPADRETSELISIWKWE